jgi:hypothetical protein
MKALLQKILHSIKLKSTKQFGKKPSKQLFATHVQVRNPPFNYHEVDKPFFAHEFSHEICATNLHEMQNVCVFMDTGAVFKGRQVLEDSFITPARIPEEFSFYHYLFLYFKGKKLTLPATERYVIAHNSWAHGFFHWVLDCLPRLYAMRDLTKGAVLLLPKSYEENDKSKGWTPFHTESLQPFQFKAIIEVEKNTCANVPNLTLASPTAESGNYNVEIMRGLRNLYHDFFVKQAPEPLTQLGDKIYITRHKAFWRKVKNDAQVIPIMQALGFAIVNLEDYTFAEKVQIAYQARFVVSIFSSGQTIAAFMQPNSFLLDLRPRDKHNLSIYALCDALEVNYLYQFCAYVDLKEGYIQGEVAPQAFNLEVDTEVLRQNLAQMLRNF